MGGQNPAGCFKSVHHRHMDIHQNDIMAVWRGLNRHDAFFSIGGNFDLGTFSLKYLARDHLIDFVIFDEEDAKPCQLALQRLNGGFSGRKQRQSIHFWELKHEMKAAPDAPRALHRNSPAHELDKPLADRQPKPGSTKAPGRRCLGLREFVEDRLDLRFVDSDAGVVHPEFDRDHMVILCNRGQAQLDPASLCEFYGVAGQVQKHLHQLVGIPDHSARRGRLYGNVDRKAFSLAFCDQHISDVLDDVADHEAMGIQFHHVCLDFGKVENVVDQPEKVARGRSHLVNKAGLRRAEIGAPQQVQKPYHGIQGRTYLVADIRQELRLCFACIFSAGLLFGKLRIQGMHLGGV